LRNARQADYLCGGRGLETMRSMAAPALRQETNETVDALVDPAPAETAPAAEALIEVRLTAIRYAAREINLYEFRRPDGAPLPAYAAGAHVDLHLPNGLIRNYSLTVAKPEPGTYTFGIKRDQASRGGSRAIHDDLRVGGIVKISAPRNNFPLDESARHSILIAGGIGITPIWCMVQRLVELKRSWTLHYACRARAEMAFLEALAAMPQAQLHFDDEHGGAPLDVAAIVAQAPRDAQLYCCGPAPMLRAFEAAAADWPSAQVHVEYFTPKAELARAGGFIVELKRSGREFFIPAGHSILSVLLDEGIDVDYSCELGICGACEQRVLAGEPVHCDSILTEEEQAENKRVMICCAGCKSERLVLDI
jgi:tetrachlorobenzoquinone reductase